MKTRKKRRKQPEVTLKKIMGASILAPFFIAEGIRIASGAITSMSDEKLSEIFPAVYKPKDIRDFYKTLSKELSD